MAIFTTEEKQNTLREAGRRLGTILNELISRVDVGVTGKELDTLAEKLIKDGGDVPAFLNYTPEGAPTPFPATLCVSVNDEIVHGIPKDTPLKEGDIISLDIGLIHKGVIVDMARTVGVGEITEQEKKLLDVTKRALDNSINAARVDGRVGDIGAAVEETVAPLGLRIVSELGGHGVGDKVHEEPFVANVGEKGKGPRIHDGEVLALEPIVSLASPDIVVESDGYTIKTKDGSRTAHFEDTILITKNGTEIVTRV